MGYYFQLFWRITQKRQAAFWRNFLESKRSSIDNMLAKFRCLEIVAMETVTNSLFFNDQYLSNWSRYCLENLAMCAPGPKVRFMFTTQFHESYRFSVIIKQSSSQGPVDVKFHMGHWFLFFWLISPNREIGFSQNFQQVSAQAWRRCLQNFVVRKLLLWKPWLILSFSLMPNILVVGHSIVLKFWEFVLQDQSNILCLKYNLLRLDARKKQCFSPGQLNSKACTGNGTRARPFCMPCYLGKFLFTRSRVWYGTAHTGRDQRISACPVSLEISLWQCGEFRMEHYFHLFSFITDGWQAVFSRNFQEVRAQAWRRGL